MTRRDVLEQEEREAREAREARDRELMPPPTRRPGRLLGEIARELNKARAERNVADAERLEDEFYRKLVTEYAQALMPTNSREKYVLLRDVIGILRETGFRRIHALEQEYRHVFDRVSFEFDDPAQQMAVDLGLEDS